MRKKIYLTENQFRKIFNISINEAFGKGKVNSKPKSIMEERPQFQGCKRNDDGTKWSYQQYWDYRETHADDSIFYPNSVDCSTFLSAKTNFEKNKNYENFKKYINAGKSLINDWMKMITAFIDKLNVKKSSGFFEPSEKFGRYDDFCGIVCRFETLPDLFEMIYFYDEFANEKKIVKILNNLGVNFVRNNKYYEPLLPSKWSSFIKILKNANTGGEPQYIPTKEEIENLPREDENIDNLDDMEIDFDI